MNERPSLFDVSETLERINERVSMDSSWKRGLPAETIIVSKLLKDGATNRTEIPLNPDDYSSLRIRLRAARALIETFPVEDCHDIGIGSTYAAYGDFLVHGDISQHREALARNDIGCTDLSMSYEIKLDPEDESETVVDLRFKLDTDEYDVVVNFFSSNDEYSPGWRSIAFMNNEEATLVNYALNGFLNEYKDKPSSTKA